MLLVGIVFMLPGEYLLKSSGVTVKIGQALGAVDVWIVAGGGAGEGGAKAGASQNCALQQEYYLS